MCTYLHGPRGSVYYFRRAIPAELRPYLGGAGQFMFSLGVKDRAEAKRLIPHHTIETDRKLSEARSRLASGAPQDRPPTAPSPARQRSASPWRSEHEQEVMALFDAEAARRDWEYDDREAARAKVRQRLAGSTASLSEQERAVRDIIRDHKAAETLATEQLGIARLQLREAPPAPITVGPAPAIAEINRSTGTMLPAIIERWFAERKVTAKTRDAAVAAARWFYEAIGPVAVEQITRRHILDFKDWLLGKGTTPANTKMKISRISGLLGYALDHDLIPINHAKDIKLVNLQASKSKRLVYSPGALSKLFAGPVHASGERPPQVRGDASYWLPLLALYTGARLEELGQLRPADVREQPYLDGEDKPHTTWAISITEDEADGLHLKECR